MPMVLVVLGSTPEHPFSQSVTYKCISYCLLASRHGTKHFNAVSTTWSQSGYPQLSLDVQRRSDARTFQLPAESQLEPVRMIKRNGYHDQIIMIPVGKMNQLLSSVFWFKCMRTAFFT